jgi:hypothetical protein
VNGAADVPAFDREALVRALRADQAGNSSFPEFLAAAWRAGVVRYDVDFAARTVIYVGCAGEEYVESYPAVPLPQGWSEFRAFAPLWEHRRTFARPAHPGPEHQAYGEERTEEPHTSIIGRRWCGRVSSCVAKMVRKQIR